MRAHALAEEAVAGVRHLERLAATTTTQLAVLSEQMIGLKDQHRTMADSFSSMATKNSADHQSVSTKISDGLARVHVRIDESNKETSTALAAMTKQSGEAIHTAMASVETERTARLRLQIKFLAWGCGALLLVLGTIIMSGLPWDKIIPAA